MSRLAILAPLLLGPLDACSTPGATDTAVTCEVRDGERIQVGEGWDSDCNRCTCQDDGSVACTEMGCLDSGV